MSNENALQIFVKKAWNDTSDPEGFQRMFDSLNEIQQYVGDYILSLSEKGISKEDKERSKELYPAMESDIAELITGFWTYLNEA